MPGIESDSSAFPFVYVRFAAQAATDDDVRELIADQRRLLGRRERFLVLVDASRPTASSSTQRKMYAEWMKEAEAPSRLYSAAIVLVIANPIIRGAMQAVLWFFTPPMPIHTFGTLDEAARCASDLMRREGMTNADAPIRLTRRHVA